MAAGVQNRLTIVNVSRELAWVWTRSVQICAKSHPETVSTWDESPFYGFADAGRSRAATTLAKFWRLCVPSQKGELLEWPQRHRETAVLPPSPNAFPSWSTISKSPSMRNGPLLKIVTFVPAKVSPSSYL